MGADGPPFRYDGRMAIPTYDISRIEVIDDATAEICRRIGPEGRLRVSSLMTGVAGRVAAEKVDRLFPNLMPNQRAWKLSAFRSHASAPDIRLHNLGKLAESVGMTEEWLKLKRELQLDDALPEASAEANGQ